MLICIPAFIILLFLLTIANTPYRDLGNGELYKLHATKDVLLEGDDNKAHHNFLIVGKHPSYAKKRTLIQFENLPSTCSHVQWAIMYLYFHYAHKASFQSVSQAPYIPRTLQVHQVKKDWSETQATSIRRFSNTNWSNSYLGIGTDASPYSLDSVTIFTGQPSGYVQFHVTEAVNNWHNGEPNYGLLIWATNEEAEGRDFRFYSREVSDSSKHPFMHVLCD